MYDVTLINLTDDARAVAPEPRKAVRHGLSQEDMRSLLQNFLDIDPVENAASDPEIRVQTPVELFRIRAGRKKLILASAGDRDAPALLLAADEVMAELDGTAPAARNASVAAHTPGRTATRPISVVSPPAPAARKRRIVVLGAIALALAATLLALHQPAPAGDGAAPFHPLPAREAASVRASFVGVYMTGPRPGQHGIVITNTGELRLFELKAVSAPGVVYASGRWGHAGTTLALATDQPGGLILIPNRDTLIYCGETYRRIP